MIKARITLIVFFSLLAGSACAADKCSTLFGLNISGGEFGTNVPGVVGIDYKYPANIQYTEAAQNGFTIVRLPFFWERLQPVPGGALNAATLAQLDNAVAQAKANSLKIILDMHNSAQYYGKSIKNNTELLRSYYDVWQKLAIRYRNSSNVMFGLMNEPIQVDAGRWAQISQHVVNVVRKQDFTGPLLVSGVIYAGVHSWFEKVGAESNAEALSTLSDPGKNLVIDVHQYFDSDYSGTHSQCIADFNVPGIFDPVTEWLRQYKFKAILGEYGGSSQSECLSAIGSTLDYIKANSDVWMGAVYWAGGGNWGPSYPYSIDFNTGAGIPQMETISKRTCR